MCILLKLPYAKFDVSRLFSSKVIENTFGGSAQPPFGKGRVKEKLPLLCALILQPLFIFCNCCGSCLRHEPPCIRHCL